MASYPKKVKLMEEGLKVDDQGEQQEKGDVQELFGQRYDTPLTLAEEETKSNKEEEMTGHVELIPFKEFSLADLLNKPGVPLEELPTVGFSCSCKHILNPGTNK